MTASRVGWLALIACLQLAAIAVLYWPKAGGESPSGDDGAVLAALNRDTVAGIAITDGGGSTVSLRRQGTRWMIDDTSLPAAADRVNRLLDALGRPNGFPVARSDGARQRFEVDDAVFQRRITLSHGTASNSSVVGEGTSTTTVYLGTSPGMRRVHARRADSDAIQTLTLSTFDVPANVDGWLDPGLLSMNGLQRVAIAGRQWKKTDKTWTTSGAQNPVPAEALDALAQALRSLQVTGLVQAGESVDDAGDTDSATATAFTATVLTPERESRAVTLRLAPASGDTQARLYSSQFDRWFTLSGYDGDRLADALAALTGSPVG